MKISVDLDCTPEEARRAVGLPDLTPLHDMFLAEMQKHMASAIKNMDSDHMIRSWMPGGQGWDQMQKFWTGLAAAGTTGGVKKDG